jgi:predicted dinucleotide-binding enzyme
MNGKQETVAILGNGVVGVAVAKGFAERGYRVVFGTRDTEGAKTREALAAVPGATAASLAEAAKAGDLAFIALPWDGLRAGLEMAGAHNLAGKVVIDATNPIDFSSGAPQLALGHSDSAGEVAQRALPEARVVKAFNIIAAAHMVHPKLPGGTPDMIIAGNDAAAKADVDAILQSFGWRPAVDLGDIKASRLLEPLALVWITYAFKNQHWTHGFSLLNQKAA